MIVVRPFLRILTAEELLCPRILPQPRSFDVFQRRNGVALSEVGRVLPLPDGALVIALLDLRNLFAEIDGTVTRATALVIMGSASLGRQWTPESMEEYLYQPIGDWEGFSMLQIVLESND